MRSAAPRVRVLLADVAPAVRSGATSIGWHIFNDGDAPIVIRGTVAPDPQFQSVAATTSLEIAPQATGRLEVQFALGHRDIGSEFKDARLILDAELAGVRWLVISTLEGRFGPGGVVLPRTAETHVERAP